MRKYEFVRLSCGILLLTLLPLVFSIGSDAAAEPLRPVFIKTNCEGKISSAVLSSLRGEFGSSQKYRLARTLTDDGQMDVVLTINMNCTERSSVLAVATAYGRAKCFGITNCHLSIDGSSLRSDLCDSKAAAECGRALFKSFDEYMSNPIEPPLKLQ